MEEHRIAAAEPRRFGRADEIGIPGAIDAEELRLIEPIRIERHPV